MDTRAAFEKALDLCGRLDTNQRSWSYLLEDREDSGWVIQLFGKVLALIGEAEVVYICGETRISILAGREVAGADVIFVTEAAVIEARSTEVESNDRRRYDITVIARLRRDIATVELIDATGLNTATDVPWPSLVVAKVTFSDGHAVTLPNTKMPKYAAGDGLRDLLPVLVAGMTTTRT